MLYSRNGAIKPDYIGITDVVHKEPVGLIPIPDKARRQEMMGIHSRGMKYNPRPKNKQEQNRYVMKVHSDIYEKPPPQYHAYTRY